MAYEQVMAIDDDSQVLESLRLVLDKKCELVCFSDGEAALHHLRRPNRVALIFLDVVMKGVDGISVLREIKKINAKVAVIIMTGFASKDVMLSALQGHADDFIEKPFDVAELEGKVAGFLGRRAQGARWKDEAPQRMKSFIERNIATVSLKDAAGDVCLSEKYFSRLFKEKNHCSFRDYKLNIKIEKARDLLKQTSYSVCQISKVLGYQNPETFMRFFKRKTGVTPPAVSRVIQETVIFGPAPRSFSKFIIRGFYDR